MQVLFEDLTEDQKVHADILAGRMVQMALSGPEKHWALMIAAAQVLAAKSVLNETEIDPACDQFRTLVENEKKVMVARKVLFDAGQSFSA